VEKIDTKQLSDYKKLEYDKIHYDFAKMIIFHSTGYTKTAAAKSFTQ